MGTPDAVRRSLVPLVLAPALAFFAAPAALAQEGEEEAAAPANRAEPAQEIEEIVVVGSQIKGSTVNEILPVAVLDAEDIELIGALSGDELFRSLPEVGDVTFQNQKTSGGVNDARGDAASINLRSFGTGNTLMLLNGRRLVNHPGYQTEDFVPVVTVNTNAIPALGIRRLEVLRDGASAIYGADAVAGVINTVLKDDLEGLTLRVRGRTYDELSRDDISGSLEYGWRSEDGRSRVSVLANYYGRDPVYATERDRSASRDLRPYVAGTPFEGDTDWRGLSSYTPWGEFDVLQRVTGALRSATSSSGRFHIQPTANSGCRIDLGDTGACIDNSSSTGSADENLRFNFNHTATMVSELDRTNLMVFANHELDEDLELFGELLWYAADTERVLYPSTSLSSARLYVPKNNYWNPFGPVRFSDGTLNPNRVDVGGLPEEGVDVQLRRYRVADAGPRVVEVENDTWRFLAGARGAFESWDWESAVAYSIARTEDVTHGRISNTLFQQALNKETPEAYNPFDGAGSLDCYLRYRDCTPNPESVMDAFRVDVYRKGETTLFTGDARVSRTDLFELPAGFVGAALGIEWRRESFEDDRDPRLDGTIPFTDLVTGTSSPLVSDVMNSSPTLDSDGSRRVLSTYLEFAVPLVGEAQEIPFVRSVDAQFAARYEDFSDVGDILVPKLALSWRVSDLLMFRGAYSEGFRAPNLVQLNESVISRVNTHDDYYRCQVDLRSGAITDVDDCPGYAVQRVASGSGQLEPEDSRNWNLGVVLEPDFGVFEGLTLTLDWWKVEKEGTVGLFGENNHILMDTLIRLENAPSDLANCGGVAGNPAVVRAAPDEDDIEFFEGSGLCPVGDVLQVIETYVNLGTRVIRGWDLGVYYALDTSLGDFDLKFNLSRIEKFFQEPGSEASRLLAAQAAGTLPADVLVSGSGPLLQLDGRPETQFAGSLRWRRGDWGAGVRVRHVGEFLDPSAVTGGVIWEVEDWTTWGADLYRTVEIGGVPTRFRLGVTNLTNEDAPLADESYGYYGTLHNHLGRSFYFDVRTRF